MNQISDDIRYLIEYDILKAVRVLKYIADELPRSFETRLLLGDAYLRSLQFELAMEQYRLAERLAPTAQPPVLKLALCLVYTGQYAAALNRLQPLVATGHHEQALGLSALLLHRLGRPKDAETRYRKLVDRAERITNHVLHAQQGLVYALRDQGQALAGDVEAMRLLGQIALRPDEAPSDLHALNSSYDHFEWSQLADKGQLAALLARHPARPDDYALFPETFVVPEQRNGFANYAARQPPGRIYIVKPRHGQGGQSIRLTSDSNVAIYATDSVVQRYIDNPYLVEGKKAHLRIYGLVAGGDPPRVYVYRDGIVRFAPELYSRGPGWLEKISMHVTNTALHRRHPKLVISTDPNEENVGNIWSLKAYLARLAADGLDAAAVFTDIARLVGRFVMILRTDKMFERQRRQGPVRGFVPKLFGLDVLLDQTARPWLIEIQRSPAWSGPPLVKRINNTLAMTLARMNISPLLDKDMPAARIAAILGDDAAIASREREIEYNHRGGFVRLVYDQDGEDAAADDIFVPGGY